MWRISRSRGSATLVIELFGPLSAGDRDALESEGERLLSFAAADAAEGDIRYVPLA